MEINISGVIGISILSKGEEKVYIFYDDHDNKKYCKKKDNFFISNFCDEIIKKYPEEIVLILEEPFIEKHEKIKVLWQDSEHLYVFRNFYTKLINKCNKSKICYGFPCDVRLALVNFTFDKDFSNKNPNNQEYKIKVSEYFNKILNLFDIINTDEQSNVLIFIKKVFSNFKYSQYYIKLKNKITNFYNKFIKNNLDKTLAELLLMYPETYTFHKGYPFNNDNIQNYNFFDEFDSIMSGIMEFYMIIIILSNKKNIKIVYAGYYHSYNLKYILHKYFDYKIIFENGTTKNIEYLNEFYIKNCVTIPKNFL